MGIRSHLGWGWQLGMYGYHGTDGREVTRLARLLHSEFDVRLNEWMGVWVCGCMYVCVYVCMCLFIDVSMCVCIDVSMYLCIYASMHLSTVSIDAIISLEQWIIRLIIQHPT